MILANPTRLASICLAVGTLAVGGLAVGSATAQTIPSAKPSADVPQAASLPAAQPTANANPSAPEPPPQRVDVDFTGGKITVDATNASLSKVLHEVAEKAGIKVTGGVSDERVFGHYGPASPAVILATLLDGTGANMLLVDDKNGSSELILTQRVGGPTPPSAVAAAVETTEDQDGRPTSRYVPPPRGFQPPGPGRGPMMVPPNMVPPQPAVSTGSNPGDPSSNESRTPQQIYEQLQNLQRQGQATQSPQ